MTQSYEQPSFHTVGYIEERQPVGLLGEPPELEVGPEALRAAPASERTTPFAAPTASRREVAFVVGLSALLHAGGAFAALNAHEDEPRRRPLSRVEIQIARPQPIRPAQVPPPPSVRPPPKLVAAPVARVERPDVHPEPANETPHESPVDTGSSLPSSADGTLYAGSGGLGLAAPAPPAPPLPAFHAEEPAKLIPPREGANYLKNPRPEYPGLARRQGWEGTTLLRVQVGPNGRALAIQVQRSSGRGTLDDAAKTAVQRWSFVPATQGNNPVAGWVTVPIVFRLQ